MMARWAVAAFFPTAAMSAAWSADIGFSALFCWPGYCASWLPPRLRCSSSTTRTLVSFVPGATRARFEGPRRVCLPTRFIATVLARRGRFPRCIMRPLNQLPIRGMYRDRHGIAAGNVAAADRGRSPPARWRHSSAPVAVFYTRGCFFGAFVAAFLTVPRRASCGRCRARGVSLRPIRGRRRHAPRLRGRLIFRSVLIRSAGRDLSRTRTPPRREGGAGLVAVMARVKLSLSGSLARSPRLRDRIAPGSISAGESVCGADRLPRSRSPLVQSLAKFRGLRRRLRPRSWFAARFASPHLAQLSALRTRLRSQPVAVLPSSIAVQAACLFGRRWISQLVH